MRHRVAFRKLNRTSSHRLAMLGNMVCSLIEHEAIRTTLPKAKEARRVAEKIITLGKRGGLSNVRLASRTVRDKGLLQKVFGDLKDRYADRPGGYTRIVRLGYRPGDSAEVALLELVDRPADAQKSDGKPAKAESQTGTERQAKKPAAEEKKPKAAKEAKADKEAKAEKKPKVAKKAAAAEAEGKKSAGARAAKKGKGEQPATKAESKPKKRGKSPKSD
jgi:large subunit ribosomal protein L17